MKEALWLVEVSLEKAMGLPAILEQLEPRSPWGRDRKAALRPFAPADAPELMDALSAVEDAKKLDDERLSVILARFREIRGALAALKGGALSEAELFEMKRFLLNAERLREMLEGQPSGARFALPELEGALGALDPTDTRDPAFSAARSDAALRDILRRKMALLPDSPAYAELLDEERRALERALCVISDRLRPYAAQLEAAIQAIGKLDFALAKARLAERFGGVRPVFGGGELILTELINPSLAGFQTISFRFARGATVLTGANMGGKSTALMAVALNVRLALMGLYPFAREVCLPHFSAICLIAGDTSRDGLSEFGAQAARLLEALGYAGGDALILVDELARGTNPEEGAAIAAAVCEYLQGMPAVSVLTTHFRGVSECAGAHYRAKGRLPGEAAGPDDYRFERVSGALDPPRQALCVLEALGLPMEILVRAKELVDRNPQGAVE